MIAFLAALCCAEGASMASVAQTRYKDGRRTSSPARGAPTAAGGVQDDDDDLPLLESMQELIQREKLALEYQLVEKDETIMVLKEKCRALEKTTASEEQRAGKSTKQRARHWPGATREEKQPLVVDGFLALSNRGLNPRRLAIVNKQYKFLKKQVEGIRLDGNGLDDTCLDGVLELLHAKAVSHLDLSGNNFGPKGASMLLACLRTSRDLGDKLEVLRLETNGVLAALPGFGADVGRVLKELWDKKAARKLFWLGLTLQDYQASGLGKAPASTVAKGGIPKPAARGGKVKDSLNALAFAKFMKQKDKPQLAVLELRHARLSPKTVDVLVHPECLRSITHLDLCNAMIGASGAQALARSLIKHADRVSLTSLSLAGNCIADFGTSALAKAMAVSETLTALDLGNNYIGDRGASDLLAALEANRGIMCILRLAHNRFSSSVVVKCLRLARLPGSTLTKVDLSGHAGAVLLRSDLDEALATNATRLQSRSGGGGSTITKAAGGAPVKLLLSWRKGYVAHEAFRNAGKDLHVRLLNLALADSHFDFYGSHVVPSGEGGGRKPAVVVRMAWSARRVVSGEADGKEEGVPAGGGVDTTRFLWRVLRERNGDTTVLARGSSSGNKDGWQPFEASFTGACGGDQLFLQFCASDRFQVPLPRQSLLSDLGGDMQVRGLSVSSSLDPCYGLLSQLHMKAPTSEAEELAVQYSELTELRMAGSSQAQKQQVRTELWKLFLEMGDGRYYCQQEVFVGSGPDVRLTWEAWVEDEEEGMPVAFTWAVIRRSFGSSEVVGRGQGPATEACWVPVETTIAGCLPGDVLVVWIGVPDRGGGGERGGGSNDKRRHAVAPYIRCLQLFLEQSEEDRAVMLRQRRTVPACVLYGSGYPVQTVERNIAWGFN